MHSSQFQKFGLTLLFAATLLLMFYAVWGTVGVLVAAIAAGCALGKKYKAAALVVVIPLAVFAWRRNLGGVQETALDGAIVVLDGLAIKAPPPPENWICHVHIPDGVPTDYPNVRDYQTRARIIENSGRMFRAEAYYILSNVPQTSYIVYDKDTKAGYWYSTELVKGKRPEGLFRLLPPEAQYPNMIRGEENPDKEKPNEGWASCDFVRQ